MLAERRRWVGPVFAHFSGRRMKHRALEGLLAANRAFVFEFAFAEESDDGTLAAGALVFIHGLR
jgi:hypothetical protein